MKKIDVSINGVDFSGAAKQLEVNIDGPVATYILTLDNQSGGSQLIEAGQPVTLGQDGHVLLRGYVEDVLSDSDPSKPQTVKSKYVKVIGNNIAADLVNLMLPQRANFSDAHIGDIINVALLASGSEIFCNPNADVFPVGTKGPIIKLLESTDRYLIDIFEDASEQSSYTYVVNQDDRHLYAFPLADVPNTNVMLYNLPGEKTNNILEVNPNGRIGSNIYNWVKVKAGKLADHLTERTAQYLSKNSATSDYATRLILSDDTSIFAVGSASIKASCINLTHSWDKNNLTTGAPYGNFGPQIKFDFPLFNYQNIDYSNISYENCSIYISHNNVATLASDKGFFVIIITDSNGRKMRWVTESIDKNEWKKIDFVLGYNAPTPSKFTIGHPDRRWVSIDSTGPETSFNWIITSIAFEFHPNGLNASGTNFSCDFWVDGLTISSSEALEIFAISEDKSSQQKYGRKMVSLYRPDLKSQLEVQAVADMEVQSRKDPFSKYTLTCEFQSNLLYAGLLVYVLAPEYHIGSGVTPEVCRIISLKHILFPGQPNQAGFEGLTVVEVVRHNGGQNINAARLRQTRHPQNAINIGHERRLMTLEDNSGGGSGGGGSGGGGGGSSSWNGGDITEDLVVKGKWPILIEDGVRHQVYDWLWTNPGNWPDRSAVIKFSDKETGNWFDIYGCAVSNGVDVGPTLGVGYNILVRGDIQSRGIHSTYEGGLLLYGGLNKDGTTQKCGWAPEGGSPFVWCVEGTDERYNTVNFFASYAMATKKVTKWSHIHANNLISEGFVGTKYLSTPTGSGNITLNNPLVPASNNNIDLGSYNLSYRDIYGVHINAGYVAASGGVTAEDIYSPSRYNSYIHYSSSGNMITLDGNVTVTGTFTGPSSNPFNQNLNTYNAVTFTDVTMTRSTTIAGNITCHGALDVTHLRANGPYSIALYNSLIPAYGGLNVGSQNNYFDSVWTAMSCYKDQYRFNCERNLSGQEVNREIQNEQDALNLLTHETTKTLYHTTYNLEKGKEDEIICTCGKSVKQPCPEHQKEWLDKYTRNTGKQEEATAFLTLEHAATLAKLVAKIEELEQQLREVKNT